MTIIETIGSVDCCRRRLHPISCLASRELPKRELSGGKLLETQSTTNPLSLPAQFRYSKAQEETVPEESHLQKPPTGKTLLRALMAAIVSFFNDTPSTEIYTAITGFSIPEVINPVSVTLFSVVPVLLGGVVYWIVSRYNVRVANVGLAIGTVILFVAFSIPSFGETITTPTTTMPAPDGFTGLSMGLHFAGPILLLALVPEWRRRLD